MTTQMNWQRIRSEFNRLADVDTLRSEAQRIGNEIRKFDIQSVLSPAAQQRVKKFEKRYSILMRTISQAQRQMDREFSRIIREIRVRRQDVNKVVNEQRSKLEEVFAAASMAPTTKSKTTKRPTVTAAKKRAPAKKSTTVITKKRKKA